MIGGMAIDITDQKRAEKGVRDSERIYRAIGESIEYGVWICDPEGRNVYASDSFLKLVGLTQRECSEFGWGAVLHPDDAERTIAAWKECVRTMGVWDIEHRFRGVDGEYHNLLARGVPVRDERGEVICWAGINLDITRMKLAEESLREADRRKDEFLAMLAHELRNPLAPIRSGLDLLALGEVTPEVIALMLRQVEQLVRLVDDLLDVSRIMRGKVELRCQPVELARIIERAEETSRPLIDAQQHALTVSLPEDPVWLEADPVRLAQVIANLLNNAAKYTEPGGRIWLTGERSDGEAVIRIRDTGVGIDPELMPHIFELFTQAERSIDRSLGGLGIGLTVAKSLTELHGGRLSARSDGPGQGSEFVISLPLRAPPEQRRLGVMEPVPASGRRILIVDDNAAAARILVLLLEKMGPHEVLAVHDGQAALEAACEFRPDLMLIDVGLPRMDGYELTRRLRERPELNGILLVALTGYGSDEDRRRSMEAGMDEHLVKPPSLDRLRSVLEHPRLRQPARR